MCHHPAAQKSQQTGPRWECPWILQESIEANSTRIKKWKRIWVWDIDSVHWKSSFQDSNHTEFSFQSSPKKPKKKIPIYHLKGSQPSSKHWDRPCPNKERSQFEGQHRSHLGSELPYGLDSLPSHGFWHFWSPGRSESLSCHPEGSEISFGTPRGHSLWSVPLEEASNTPERTESMESVK